MTLARTLVGSLFLALAPIASAGVRIVDVGGGVGTFPTIQQAVDLSADGDVILVKPGSYATFALVNRGLTVAADVGGPVQISGGIRIRNLAAGKTAVLIGLTVDGLPPGMPGATHGLVATSNQGSVRCERCTFTARQYGPDDNGWAAVRIEACADVALSHCICRGSAAHQTIQGLNDATGGPGVFALASSLTLHESSLFGGVGYDGTGLLYPDGSNGGHGYLGRDSTLFASTSEFRGGRGGNAWYMCSAASGSIGYGGFGGSALWLQSPGDLARLVSTVEVPGFGGLSFDEGCVPYIHPTAPVRVGAVASFVDLPVQGRTMSVATNPVRELTSSSLSVSGLPGDRVTILIASSTSSQFVPAWQSQHLLSPDGMARLLAATLPGGASSLTFSLPDLGVGVLSRTYFLQPLFTSPGGAQTLGTAIPLLILDSSL